MKIQEERVLLLMEENGITQRKMAQDLAISPTTLNGYLHGKYLHVPDDVIREIADYLQVSVDYITDRSALLQIGNLSLIHISEPTRRTPISYAVFCLKKKKRKKQKQKSVV